MVVLALGENLWVAFNPATCAVQKVWRGDIDFRGKVWDFSQDNCAAKGTVLADASPPLLELAGKELPSDWEASGVSVAPSGGLAMTGDSATLTSPAIDTVGMQRLFVAFDELSRAGPVLVEVSDDDGATWDAQNFRSATHVTSDTDWQWNFKELEVRSPATRVRFVQEKGAYRKRLRDIRVFGDRLAWTARAEEGEIGVEPVWRGYEFDRRFPGVVLKYDLRLANAGAVVVRHFIDVTTAPEVGWTESIEIDAAPTDMVVSLALPRTRGRACYVLGGPGMWRAGEEGEGSVLEFRGDGVTRLSTSVKESR